MALRRVHRDVVQLPFVGVDARLHLHDRVVRHRLPAFVVEGATAEHLVVLREVGVRRCGIGDGGKEARPLDGALGDAADLPGRFDPHGFEHGRHDVDGMDVLAPEPGPTDGAAPGPMHDQRVSHPALVHLSLPAAERRVPGHRPTPRVVVVPAGPADLVDVRQRLFQRGGDTVPRPHVVERPGRATLRARPVVREHEEQRIVEVPGVAQVVHEAAYLVIGVRKEAGERLHEAGVEPALVGGERVPRRHPIRPGRELGALGQHAVFDLALGGGLPPLVPAVVEGSVIAGDPLRRGLVR